jgi:hypothetical protein
MNWWDEDIGSSIACYPHHLTEGAEACDRLLARPGLPLEVEDAARKNATWYSMNFPAEILWSLDWFDGWSCFNPSIAANPDGDLSIIVRQANYRIHPGGRYEIPSADDGVIKTRNLFGPVRVAPDGAVHVGPLHVLEDDAVTNPDHPFPVWGVEDCRLYLDKGWWVAGTVRDRDSSGICTILAAPIEEDRLGPAQQLSCGHTHDKNWMPLSTGKGIIDRVYPLILRAIDGARVSECVDAPWLARAFRGGTQVLWWPAERVWLGLVHEAANFPDDPEHWRVYTHRWVGWDVQWNLRRISRPFTFAHRGVEFAAGMVWQGEDLLVSYGLDDACARLIRIETDDVVKALKIASPHM